MKEQEQEMTIPHLFRCPISLELFKDPVTLCTGQTYDRASIEQWLASGNLTCPVTMQHLHDSNLVPNHTLRHLIQLWLNSHNNNHQNNPHSFQSLKRSLDTKETQLGTRLQILNTILVLSEDSFSVSCLVQLGFVPFLLELCLARRRSIEQDTEFVERALLCVVKLLPLSDLECLNFLINKMESFTFLLEQGSLATKASLCRIIAMSSTCPNLCLTMGKTRKLVTELVLLIHQGSEASAEALWGLSCCASNLDLLVNQGVVNGLISYLSNSTEKERGSLAMALLERLLVELESARECLMNNPSGVGALVKRVFRVSDHGESEAAVGSIMAVCGGSFRARELAVEEGVLTQLLLLLQSQCSFRTKSKARMLLKLLRSNS